MNHVEIHHLHARCGKWSFQSWRPWGRLPIRSQLVEVTLTLCGELSKCLDSDVGDETPFEGDEKLSDVMGLQLLNVQVPSLEQDATTGHIQCEPLDWRVQSQMTTLTSWHARPGILRETSSELLCSTELRKVDEGKRSIFMEHCCSEMLVMVQKLPDVMGLQLLNVQVPSLEQDGTTATFNASPWTGAFSRK